MTMNSQGEEIDTALLKELGAVGDSKGAFRKEPGRGVGCRVPKRAEEARCRVWGERSISGM